MKKVYLIVLLTCAFLLLANPSNAAMLKIAMTTTPPVELQKGWNIVSVPCDIEASKLEKGGGDSSSGKDGRTKFYKWGEDGYEEAAYLYRGEGYIVNTNNIQNTSSICNGGEVAEPKEIVLEKGWNLVGNPYHKSYKVEDLFGAAYSSISAIYEYSGNKYSELKGSDHFKPWRGYWAYVEDDVEIEVFNKCFLTIKSDRDEMKIGIKAKLEVIYSCESKVGETEIYDVTDDVEWMNINPEVGSIENAEFIPIAEGTANITAIYKENYSYTIIIKVQGKFVCDEVIITYVYEEEADEAGFCGNYSYFPYSYVKLDNTYFGFSGYQCRKCGKDGAITCRDNFSRGKETETPVLWTTPGELPLKAFCVEAKNAANNNAADEVFYSEYEDVTETFDWQKLKGGALSVSGSKVNGKMGNGTVYICTDDNGNIGDCNYWDYSKFRHTKVYNFLVVDPDSLFTLKFKSGSVTMKSDSSFEDRLLAVKNHNFITGTHNVVRYSPNYDVKDVTDKGTYKISSSHVSYIDGIVYADSEASGAAGIAGE